MIINTRKVETYIFELDGDFYIEVAETAKKDFFEFYISHKDYAVKDLIGTYKCKEKDIRNIVKE